MNWIHFIGAKYYSISGFKKEAKTYGINRAVAPNIFKKMELGDRVYLAQGDSKSSKIFGYFEFTNLAGLNDDLIDRFESVDLIELTSSKTYDVIRGCGRYVVKGEYKIVDMDGVIGGMKMLDDKEIGKVMVGGKFHPLTDVGIPTDQVSTYIPFTRGFRTFDGSEFIKAYHDEVAAGKKIIKPRGMFYGPSVPAPVIKPSSATITAITDYSLKK